MMWNCASWLPMAILMKLLVCRSMLFISEYVRNNASRRHMTKGQLAMLVRFNHTARITVSHYRFQVAATPCVTNYEWPFV
jgi:hypothetical protein